MGVPERGDETGRLHFHFLVYVPDGEMVGRLYERRQYSRRKGRTETVQANDFFERKFGKTDFEELNMIEMRRVIYSRGIPTEFCKRMDENAFAAPIEDDYVPKFVVFDNVIDWERDIKPLTQRRLRLVA